MEDSARHAFPGLASAAALGMITIYQRWVSPYKGYRCAHAVLHGGPGCSGFAKRAIRENGLWRAIALTRQRFRDCRAAMLAMAAQQNDPTNGDITEEELENARRHRTKKKTGWCGRDDWAMAACEAPGACCGSGGGAAVETKAGFCGLLGSFGALGCCGN